MMKVLVGFIIGVMVGIAAALLMAPSSGEDLRQQMSDQATVDLRRMRDEYRRGMEDLQARMDRMLSDLKPVVDVEPDNKPDAA